MAVACGLLQVLKSMPTVDRNAMTIQNIASTEFTNNNKDLLIMGSLSVDGEIIIRRFPIIDFEDHSKLTVLKEKASVIFDRFLHGSKFNFCYKGSLIITKLDF